MRLRKINNDIENNYRDIAAMTGASTTTVARVARFLNQENYQGYKLVLGRMHIFKE